MIELILVVALLAVMAGLAIPVVGSFNNRSQMDATTQDVISALRFAEGRAMAVEQGSRFGVYFDTAARKFYVFRGDNFGTNPAENIEYGYSSSLNLAESFSGHEVNFEKLTGETFDAGNIVLTNNVGQTVTISVTAEGKIERE